jgi:hypothetical protein
LSPADVATDAGWLEYELLLENRGSTSLLVSSVKLLTASGRYLPAAANYAETVSPPSAAYGIAGEVATSAAGVAAGQVVPYGGLFVRAIADIAEASSADARARAEQRFRLRRVAAVELAPGGRMEGSAFLPRVPDAQALAVDFSYEGAARRVMLPVPRPAGR